MTGIQAGTKSERRDNLADVSAQIKSQALSLGFHKVGIIPAAALSTEHERLKEWLRRGFDGEMSWMVRDPEQRIDPQKLFADARSVIGEEFLRIDPLLRIEIGRAHV